MPNILVVSSGCLSWQSKAAISLWHPKCLALQIFWLVLQLIWEVEYEYVYLATQAFTSKSASLQALCLLWLLLDFWLLYYVITCMRGRSRGVLCTKQTLSAIFSLTLCSYFPSAINHIYFPALICSYLVHYCHGVWCFLFSFALLCRAK